MQGDQNQILVFGLGLSQTQCITIPILNDEVLEETEQFTILLSSDQECVLFENDTVQVTILDNDCKSSFIILLNCSI